MDFDEPAPKFLGSSVPRFPGSVPGFEGFDVPRFGFRGSWFSHHPRYRREQVVDCLRLKRSQPTPVLGGNGVVHDGHRWPGILERETAASLARRCRGHHRRVRALRPRAARSGRRLDRPSGRSGRCRAHPSLVALLQPRSVGGKDRRGPADRAGRRHDAALRASVDRRRPGEGCCSRFCFPRPSRHSWSRGPSCPGDPRAGFDGRRWLRRFSWAAACGSSRAPTESRGKPTRSSPGDGRRPRRSDC